MPSLPSVPTRFPTIPSLSVQLNLVGPRPGASQVPTASHVMEPKHPVAEKVCPSPPPIFSYAFGKLVVAMIRGIATTNLLSLRLADKKDRLQNGHNKWCGNLRHLLSPSCRTCCVPMAYGKDCGLLFNNSSTAQVPAKSIRNPEQPWLDIRSQLHDVQRVG